MTIKTNDEFENYKQDQRIQAYCFVGAVLSLASYYSVAEFTNADSALIALVCTLAYALNLRIGVINYKVASNRRLAVGTSENVESGFRELTEKVGVVVDYGETLQKIGAQCEAELAKEAKHVH